MMKSRKKIYQFFFNQSKEIARKNGEWNHKKNQFKK
jgi:hypothetical protein